MLYRRLYVDGMDRKSICRAMLEAPVVQMKKHHQRCMQHRRYFHPLSITFIYLIHDIHFHPLPSIVIPFHPLSFILSTLISVSTFIHFHSFSSTFIHLYPLSTTFIHFHPISPTFIHFQPFSSISSTFIHFHQFSPTFIHFHRVLTALGLLCFRSAQNDFERT